LHKKVHDWPSVALYSGEASCEGDWRPRLLLSRSPTYHPTSSGRRSLGTQATPACQHVTALRASTSQHAQAYAFACQHASTFRVSLSVFVLRIWGCSGLLVAGACLVHPFRHSRESGDSRVVEEVGRLRASALLFTWFSDDALCSWLCWGLGAIGT
jgi:hypothetical protein